MISHHHSGQPWLDAHGLLASPAQVNNWLAGIEDGLRSGPLTPGEDSLARRDQHSTSTGAVARSETDASYTDVCPSSFQSTIRHIPPSESGSISSSPEANRHTQAQSSQPAPLTTTSAPPSIRMTVSSVVAGGAPASDGSVGPRNGSRRETSDGLHASEQTPARSTSSAGSGPSRATPSRKTTSSASSILLYPDFHAPPIDLQLPPVTRAIPRAAIASRSSVTLANTSASLGTQHPGITSAGQVCVVLFIDCATCRPTRVCSSPQSTASVMIGRSRMVFERPTYPKATALNLHGGAPLKTDTTLFDDMATLLRPTPPLHAPALGYYSLARDTTRRPLVLVNSERPFGGAGSQDNILSEMLRTPYQRN